MSLWVASRPARLAVVAQAAEGGNISRRRSQRLNKQGRTRPQGRDLQQQLKEREARLAEQQRLLQDDPDVLVPPSEDEEEEPEEAARAQEDAVRNLVQQLRQWPPREGQSAKADAADAEGVGSSTPALPAAEPVPAAPAAAAPPVGSSIDSSAAGAVDIPPLDVVEADYILEERLGQAAGAAGAAVEEEDVPPPVASRQAQALLAIMQAGEGVEEAIAQHREDIDEEMLQLLERRIQAAEQLEEEAREEVLAGLQLLYRRLAAEVERQRAPPTLRLLDELLNILDPPGAGFAPTRAEREERQRKAAVRLRAAFVGGLAAEADVLSLAAQLGGSGGTELADQLVADPVDPKEFMADCTELLTAAQQQQQQVATYLQKLPEVPEGADEEAAGRAAAQRAQLEALLEERRAAAALVVEALEVAEAVARQLRGL